MRRVVVGALALVVALTGLVGGTAAASPDCANAEAVETYQVEAAARRSAYRVGQTAIIDLFVTDSITGMPASDVDAGLLIQGRDEKGVAGADTTDDEGHLVLHLELKPTSVRPGWARGTAAAWQAIDTPVYCATPRYGYSDYPRLFRIRN